MIKLAEELVKKNKITCFFLLKKKIMNLKDKIKNSIPGAIISRTRNSNISSPALVTCLGNRLDFAIINR